MGPLTPGPKRSLVLLLALLLGVACSRPGMPGPPAPGSLQPTPESIVRPTEPAALTARYAEERQQMVKFQILDRDVKDPQVLRVMESVPRHEFVPSEYVDQAYEDHPLPIGYGQTISQPYIVAAMTELLRIGPGSKVLEVGTGSGYQAAILAAITPHVYTLEIVEPLCKQAAERLTRLGYSSVQVKCGDGYYGWEEHAPYDAIIVTCAPDHIPQPLVSQLADGGRMVIPVGPPGAYQVLWLVERQGQEVKSERLMGVAFVPLTGKR